MSNRQASTSVFLEENVLQTIVDERLNAKPELVTAYNCLVTLHRDVHRIGDIVQPVSPQHSSIIEEGNAGLEQAVDFFIEGIITRDFLDIVQLTYDSNRLHETYNHVERILISTLDARCVDVQEFKQTHGKASTKSAIRCHG